METGARDKRDHGVENLPGSEEYGVDGDGDQ
jgi:hypothetical protein